MKNRLHWSLLILTLYALVVMSGCAYYNSLYNAERYYQRGKTAQTTTTAQGTLAGRTDFDKSIDAAAGLIELYPTSKWVPKALLLMAKSYYETGQYPKAERKCIELETNYSNHPLVIEANLVKAQCWIALKREKEARELLRTLQSSNDPAISAPAGLLLIDAMMQDSLFEQAIPILEKIQTTTIDPLVQSDANAKLGTCHEHAKRFLIAAERFEKAASAPIPRAKIFEYRSHRAELLMLAGKPSTALIELKKLYRDGDFRMYRMRAAAMMADAELMTGDTTRAIELWSEVLEKTTTRSAETSQASLSRGKYRLSIGALDSLIDRDLERARTDKPDAKSAIQADSLKKRVLWQRNITTRLDSSNTLLQYLYAALKGDSLPDSIRIRFSNRHGGSTSVTMALPKDDTTSHTPAMNDSIADSKVDSKLPVEPSRSKTDTSKAVSVQQAEMVQDTALYFTLDSAHVRTEIKRQRDLLAVVYSELIQDDITHNDTVAARNHFPLLLQYASGRMLQYARFASGSFSEDPAIRDSLLRLTAVDSTDQRLANLARKRLSMDLIPDAVDSNMLRLQTTERELLASGDTARAIIEYHAIAAADSNDAGDRAAAAAALLSIGRVELDSLMQLFTALQTRYPNGRLHEYAKHVVAGAREILYPDTTKRDSATTPQSDSTKVLPIGEHDSTASKTNVLQQPTDPTIATPADAMKAKEVETKATPMKREE